MSDKYIEIDPEVKPEVIELVKRFKHVLSEGDDEISHVYMSIVLFSADTLMSIAGGHPDLVKSLFKMYTLHLNDCLESLIKFEDGSESSTVH